ncbi:DNA polymerase III subunit beta [Fusobacterium nucleatum subsp. nucleatum ATCC 23726]|uniref:DNA polymerase III subunit beta n=3 Tax=Fusobacterium nucleatum subsp. nucleatum TaxID=76856 RepID=Q8RFZ0_FUSNN|nr:DNA polymerase III subunit beta [Fusobacterium nucleatum]AAL94732.1 DNA polymerase III, beta chain [Fusobacterium nucleatum subsp. nucleatum ATCC 25586]ALF23961.1 DNA polymerase III subunit beta [Fusobacterium nucleatum subsp. nucleatum ChDC F316]ALF25016.1 DNA polymerase III subunit beta [Fusobacterium nucleatum subsp. nucleatum]ASG26707.1 DNA polymerase III subunit beta [Fusobacterium nucleatum subsp. nucleatum]AVQ14976.1 DNA polymerase III subunit beta [Fusobacterium nucleatum subsp. nuc
MHIKVNRQNFLSAIRIVEKSVKENKIKPILSCIYAKVKGNKIYFTGTNLDTTIKTSIDVNEVIREGEVAFYYSIIDEYLKEIKDEFVVLRVENGNILFIETEDSTTEYDVFSAEDYPNTFENIVLNENNFKFEMPSQELVNIFEKVLFSADTPDNIAMNCIRIESILKHLHFVSTNTYRLTFLKKNIDKDISDFSVSVPADTISSIIKIIKGLDNEVIKIYKEDAHLYFQYKDTMIITKLIELRFPNYAEILSNISYDKKLHMNNDKLTNLLKRILIFSRSNSESKYSSTYEFKHNEENKNKMAISALNEIARINEELDVNFEGEDLKISLNSKYLLEFIQNIPKEKELVLEFMYSNSAVKVYEKDNDEYIYILMPLALRE